MKQLVVLSGKGGTGKTTVAASLVALAKNRVYADCDVDAPNLQLVCAPDVIPVVTDFYGYKKAIKYDDLCINCGKCETLCAFGAIQNGKVNPYECEGCGVCEAFCPSANHNGEKAIRLEPNVSGQTMVYQSADAVFSTAELKMGNGASGKLVTEVRRNLYNTVKGQELAIIDGSPGIGCPVIASITGTDMVLVVTEPTLSGLHDMERVIYTARRFETVCVVCINKFDVNLDITERIEAYCTQLGIPVVGRIPFDPKVVTAINEGRTIISMDDSPAVNEITKIWGIVTEMINI